MLPGWGSQWTRPQRKVWAEKRSSIVVITSLRERPSPEVERGPRSSVVRSGFRDGVLEEAERGGELAGMVAGAERGVVTPGEPVEGPRQGEVMAVLSQRRTPSIHSAVMTRLEESSG